VIAWSRPYGKQYRRDMGGVPRFVESLVEAKIAGEVAPSLQDVCVRERGRHSERETESKRETAKERVRKQEGERERDNERERERERAGLYGCITATLSQQ